MFRITATSTCYFLSFLPGGYLLYLIHANSVNIPHWDEWDQLISIFKDYYSPDGVTFSTFWKGGEHITFFPRIIVFLIGLVSKINLSWIHILIGFVAISSHLMIMLLVMLGDEPDNISSANTHSTISKCIMSMASSVLIFTYAIPGVYLWAQSLYTFITIISAIILFHVVSQAKMGLINIILATILIVIAAYSSLYGGILSLIVLLLYCMRYYYNRSAALALVVIWFFIVSLVIVSSYVLYSKVTGNRPDGYLFSHGIISFIKFVLIYLGTSLSMHDIELSMCFGAIGVLLLFIVFSGATFICFSNRRAKLNRGSIFFFCVMLFASATSIVTAIGREGVHGYSQAFTDRYFPFSGLFWISSIYFLLKISSDYKHGNYVGLSLCGIFLYFCALTSLMGLPQFKNIHDDRLTAMNELVYGFNNYKSVDFIYPNGSVEIPTKRISFLQNLKLGPFANLTNFYKPNKNIKKSDWVFDGGWSLNAIGSRDGVNSNDDRISYYYGTFSNKSSPSGSIRSLSQDGAGQIRTLFLIYNNLHSTGVLRLGLFIDDSSGRQIRKESYSGEILVGKWSACLFDFHLNHGERYSFFMEYSNIMDFSEWVAFAEPIIVSDQL